jgi:hypothetical protein
MDDLLTNPTTARRFNPRRDQYLKNRDPDKAPIVHHEQNLQRQVCQYLKLQYPKAIFRSDTSSGRWEYSRRDLAAKVIYNSQKSWPDLFIYEPRFIDGVQYAGLALELKKEGTTIIIKKGARKGHLTTNPHIQEQALLLKELKKRGYFATFAIGFDHAQKTIDWYFGRPATENAELPF